MMMIMTMIMTMMMTIILLQVQGVSDPVSHGTAHQGPALGEGILACLFPHVAQIHMRNGKRDSAYINRTAYSNINYFRTMMSLQIL